MICKIADFIIQFGNAGYNFEKTLGSFVCDDTLFHTTIKVTRDEALIEKSVSEDKTLILGQYAVVMAFRKLSEWLPLHNAFVLHSCTIDVNGQGVAFSAISGTGKTTHMRLWQQLLGDKMTIVNGDKPIVRCFDEEPQIPYAYGTPWNGKENLGCNMRTPLKHICFITRSEQNSTVPLTKQEALPRIMNQVYMPKDPAAIAATLQLINRLLDSVQLWEIRCNMDIDAAKTAYNAIFGASNKN